MSDDERNGRAYRAVSGRSPRTEPDPAPTNLDFTGSLNLLYARVQSQAKLAGILGVPRRTLRRWLDGEVPGRTELDRQRRDLVQGAARGIIKRDDDAALQAVRRSRLTPARERKIRGATTLVVKVTMRYDADDERTIRFQIGAGGTLGIAAGAVDAVVDAFLNGATAQDGPEVQNEGIFAPLAYGMVNDWYRDAFLDREPDALAFDVENVKFV